MFRLLLVAALVVTSGCVSKATVNGTESSKNQLSHFAIPYVTNRNLATNRNSHLYYGDERGSVSTGFCEVEIKGVDLLKRKANVLGFEVSSMGEVISQFMNASSGNLVVYVHGYNIDFDKGCRRVAMLQDRLGLVDRMLLFSWPADGRYLNYTRDVADLEWSIPDLEDLLTQLSDQIGPDNIDIVGHSLGARGLVDTLSHMSESGDAPLFNQVILVAPDIDIALFRRDVQALSAVSKLTTVYVSANDRALTISREVNGYPRLGQAINLEEAIPEIDIVDISRTGIEEISGHLYHLHNPHVIEDISRLLGTSVGFPGIPFRRVETGQSGVYQLLPEQ